MVSTVAVEKPSTADELARRLHDAASQKLAVVPVGGGRASGMGGAPERLDVELHTTRLDRVIEHSQADMVVSVEAGITLEALQHELAKSAQFLPLDPFSSPGHTIGGLLATGWTGPLRLRFGSPRDFLIGIRVALLTVSSEGGWDAADQALTMPVAPSALEIFSDGRVLARYTGSGDAVDRVVRDLGWPVEDHSIWERHSGRAPARWARIAAPRSALRGLVEGLPRGAGWWASPGIGVAHWAIASDTPSVKEVRARTETAGGSLVMMAAPDDFMRDVGAWGTPPPTIDIMRRLKHAFDPDHVLNPGRFVV